MINTKHDLTTAAGVFGYFAEHTQIFKPIEAEFQRLQQENSELKQKNEMLEQAVLELSMLVGEE